MGIGVSPSGLGEPLRDTSRGVEVGGGLLVGVLEQVRVMARVDVEELVQGDLHRAQLAVLVRDSHESPARTAQAGEALSRSEQHVEEGEARQARDVIRDLLSGSCDRPRSMPGPVALSYLTARRKWIGTADRPTLPELAVLTLDRDFAATASFEIAPRGIDGGSLTSVMRRLAAARDLPGKA
jgi:hypothetical protein